MSMDSGELLQRIAATLKADIGPEITNEFAKTQAFMASVVLDKVSKQLSLAPGHAAEEITDVRALLAELEPLLADVDGPVASALSTVADEQSISSLGPLIDALYSAGDPGMSSDRANSALQLIRPVLRRDIDRRMEIAT